MSVRIVFLGTSASVPTVHRNVAATALLRKGELMLFDCGEGTQRQMVKAGLGFGRKMKIFISHMHGDHVLGLPGLFQTMSLMGRVRPLHIYGPPGLRKFITSTLESIVFHLSFEIPVAEREGGEVCNEAEYTVQSLPVDHSVFTLGYALCEKDRPGRFYAEKARALGIPEGPLWKKLQTGQPVRVRNGSIVESKAVLGQPRRGFKVVYISDTRPCEAAVKLSMGADILIYDGTFDDELRDKAKAEGHSTVVQAAEVAKEAHARKLVLTHISARYENVELLKNQASSVYENVIVANDFMSIMIKYDETVQVTNEPA